MDDFFKCIFCKKMIRSKLLGWHNKNCSELIKKKPKRVLIYMSESPKNKSFFDESLSSIAPEYIATKDIKKPPSKSKKICPENDSTKCMNQSKKCEFCNAMVSIKNIEKHKRKCVILKKSNLIETPNKKLRCKIEPPNEKLICKKVTKGRPLIKMEYNYEEKSEICPVCNGDGGVNAGCYKCEGSGWISSKARVQYSVCQNSASNNDDSRISNANYLGNHIGANYRESDGRFGSNPEHDDYSDEGDA